jgi:hypothetical protein
MAADVLMLYSLKSVTYLKTPTTFGQGLMGVMSWLLGSSVYQAPAWGNVVFQETLLTRQDFYLYPADAHAPQADFSGGTGRKVNDTTVTERAPVIDSNHDLLASMDIRNPHPGAKGKRSMGRREGVLVKYLTASALATVKPRTVPGGHAGVGGGHQTHFDRGGGHTFNLGQGRGIAQQPTQSVSGL